MGLYINLEKDLLSHHISRNLASRLFECIFTNLMKTSQRINR